VNEWEDEYEAEHLLESIDEYDEDEAQKIKEEITYYRKYVWRHYFNRITETEISLAQIEALLEDYNPRKTKYRALKKWITAGVELAKKGFDYTKYDYPDILDEDFYDNGEQSPYVYIKFVWSHEGQIGKGIATSMSDQVSNFGLIPLTETAAVTKENIEDPLKQFGITKTFYEWMSEMQNLHHQF